MVMVFAADETPVRVESLSCIVLVLLELFD